MFLDDLVAAHKPGTDKGEGYLPLGIPSVCSSHPVVLEAAMRSVQPGFPLLIEATCHQVNQYGGYSGLTPEAFVRFVHGIAEKTGFPKDRLILGGDHLGPVAWADEPAGLAMQKARVLVNDFAQAGFSKLHLDASVPCADDLDLPLEVIAQRTAGLAETAEISGNAALRYVVGSEVPTPGGGQAGELRCRPTTVQSAQQTLEAMRSAFHESPAAMAWERVIALVVQPGIEFDSQSIQAYDSQAAQNLAGWIETVPGMVFEAHSTDYQSLGSLRHLVADHFAILKVGPALTFAYRQAVFALAQIEAEMGFDHPSHLRETLECAMLADPTHWQRHYSGSPQELRLARTYSFSDRIRYYWNIPAVQQALAQLQANLSGELLPLTLLSQYLPQQSEAIRDGRLDNSMEELIQFAIGRMMGDYWRACGS